MPRPDDRPTLDRRADERRTAGLLDAVLATTTTRVLDVIGDRLPVAPASPPAPGSAGGGSDARARRLTWRAPVPGEAARGWGHVFLGRDQAATAYVAALRDAGEGIDPTAPASPTAPTTATAPTTPATEHWAGLREVGAWLDGLDYEAAMTAVGLARWHARHGFCPRCGSPAQPVAAGWVRRCTAEGSEQFPRTDPAVIVAITDPQDRLLLGRGPTFKERWVSVLAGFVEPGETLEAAVVREMAEEVGLTLGEVTYVGSQPWPFPASLMLGFTARATDAALRPDPQEIAEVAWYTREQLATEIGSGRLGIPGRLSIARRLIEDWYGGPLRQRREPASIRSDAG